MVAPNIGVSSVWSLPYVTHLASRMLQWFLDVWPICAPVPKTIETIYKYLLNIYKNISLMNAAQQPTLYYRASFQDLRLDIANVASVSHVRASAMILRVVRN
jgi:hypothetical protein